ncbi:hypothetical protein AQJ30_14700 [Streptomyces longwoodensis]|uniref:Uncharacterized protein n=1 Tax=Streptomyces longwoodensis TaxID=68231 RepID=A0A117QNI4_9ACTN|nr:hypothetical protein AQJ30_14700 [Streptomyces longwoodensis]
MTVTSTSPVWMPVRMYAAPSATSTSPVVLACQIRGDGSLLIADLELVVVDWDLPIAPFDLAAHAHPFVGVPAT